MATSYIVSELLKKLDETIYGLDEIRRLTGNPGLQEDSRVQISMKELKARHKMTPEQLAEVLGGNVQPAVQPPADSKQEQKTDGQPEVVEPAVVGAEALMASIEVPEATDEGRLVDEVAWYLSQRLSTEVTRSQVLDAIAFFDTGPELRTRSDLEMIERRVQEQMRVPEVESSLGSLLVEYRQRGFIGLTVGTVKAIFRQTVPEIQVLDFDSVVTPELRKSLTDVLTPLMLVCKETERDVAMRHPSKWEVTDVRFVNPEADEADRIVEFTAACGHPTKMEWKTAKYRAENDNTRVGVFFALCLDCLQKRIERMEHIPGTATQNSHCLKCDDWMFGRLPAWMARKQQKMSATAFEEMCVKYRLRGYLTSRRELVDNLQRNVLSIINLPGRLAPEHRDSDNRCIEKRAEQLKDESALFEACDRALADFGLKVYALITQNTEIKARILAKQPDREREIRAQFKLPADPEAYAVRKLKVTAHK